MCNGLSLIKWFSKSLKRKKTKEREIVEEKWWNKIAEKCMEFGEEEFGRNQ